MNYERFLALTFSASTKTSVLKGIVSEKEYLELVKNDYEYIIEDAMVITNVENWSKKIFVKSEVMKSDQFYQLAKIFAGIGELFLLKVEESGAIKIKSNVHDWEDINTRYSINQLNKEFVKSELIDMKANTNIIANFDFDQVRSYVERVSFSSMIELYFNDKKSYTTNLDLIAFDGNDFVFIELKQKSSLSFIEWMNPGEYNLYRRLVNNGAKFKYMVKLKGTFEWSEYNAEFSYSPTQRAFGASTSFSGKKAQKVYKIENCYKK